MLLKKINPPAGSMVQKAGKETEHISKINTDNKMPVIYINLQNK